MIYNTDNMASSDKGATRNDVFIPPATGGYKEHFCTINIVADRRKETDAYIIKRCLHPMEVGFNQQNILHGIKGSCGDCVNG